MACLLTTLSGKSQTIGEAYCAAVIRRLTPSTHSIKKIFKVKKQKLYLIYNIFPILESPFSFTVTDCQVLTGDEPAYKFIVQTPKVTFQYFFNTYLTILQTKKKRKWGTF